MELASKSRPFGGSGSKSLPIVVAGIAAIIAAVLVYAALHAAGTKSTAAGTTSVVVSRQLIPKGSSAAAIASDHAFRVTDVRGDAVIAGAVTDISQIRGKVATDDIYPGQQLSRTDFSAGNGSLTTKLASGERAIALPIDTAHGLVGQVRAGDRVDVLGGFNLDSATGSQSPVMRALASNVTVLTAPKAGSGSGSSNQVVTLRVKADIATQLAFAADNGKVWLALRPGGDGRSARPDVVTVRNLLFGSKSVGGE